MELKEPKNNPPINIPINTLEVMHPFSKAVKGVQTVYREDIANGKDFNGIRCISKTQYTKDFMMMILNDAYDIYYFTLRVGNEKNQLENLQFSIQHIVFRIVMNVILLLLLPD